jgi:hypothetical protein
VKALAALWDATVGLLVEDGWIASGTVAALIAIALLERASGGETPLVDLGGPLLFVLLMALLLTNLYAAGRKARNHLG